MNRTFRLAAAALIAITGMSAALAQNFPTKPIKFVVPYPPGGASDVTARILGQKLSEAYGQPVMIEKLLSWFVFWTVGVAYLYNFVFHVFFGEMAARFVGWTDSPFQLEVGTASLGFAAVGFLAAFRSFDLRLAAILGPGIFCLGAAAGHIHQMITAHNFAPGNAGVIFWMDILLPLFGAALLWLSRNAAGHRAAGLVPQAA